MKRILVVLRKYFRKLIFPTDEVLAVFGGKNFHAALDIGAGTGMFLEILQGRGIISDGHGVEVDKKYFKRVSDNIKITQLDDVNGKFDLLVFNDVLHHVDDKKTLINFYVGTYLTDMGYVLVKEMNPKNIFFKYFNRLHDLIFAGELIREISPKGLDALVPKSLKKVGEGSKRKFLYDHYYILYQSEAIKIPT